MPILCINTRDELIVFRCEHIAYFRADHNYTTAVYINGTEQVVCKGLSFLEQQLSLLYSPAVSPFVRIGRSILVNTAFVMSVSVAKKRIILSDCNGCTQILSVSQAVLRTYKNLVETCLLYISSDKVVNSDINCSTSDKME